MGYALLQDYAKSCIEVVADLRVIWSRRARRERLPDGRSHGHQHSTCP